MKSCWFVTKTYGWGWTPSTWEGWTVLLVYFFLLLGGAFVLGPDRYTNAVPVPFFIYLIVLTIVLLSICWKTGEKPRWQWGKKEKI